MILIALGANLPSAVGPPRATLAAALAALAEEGDINVAAVSRWYASAAVPASDQPDYVNGTARIETALQPRALLDRLLAVERRFGRERSVPNAARSLDLDLLAYGARVIEEAGLHVPHPRLAERAFVLKPLIDVAPGWRHPVSDLTAEAMLAALSDAAATVLLEA